MRKRRNAGRRRRYTPQTSKKYSALRVVPWIVMLAALVIMFFMDHEISFSPDVENTVNKTGMDQWEYYFTPFYEKEAAEGAEGSLWTMQP